MNKEQYGTEEIYLAPEKTSLSDTPAENGDDLRADANEEMTVTVEPEPEKAVRIGEILALRTENRKVFRMSDGSEQAVYYPETVHVFDEDTNTFDEADHTLIAEEDGKHFVSAQNHFRASFSREEENDELFSIESGMHRVTVYQKTTSRQKHSGIQPRVHRAVSEDAERTDTLIFPEAQEGADYEYSVTGDGVKENIIVRSKADLYRYSFLLRQENVTAAPDEAGRRIAFISNETGEEVLFIPAPFMIDANGDVSCAASYEIKNAANGDILLSVVADSEWMNAEGRAFPVVIDPQIQVNGNSAMTTYSWDNGRLYSSSLHTVGTTGCGDGSCNAKRMYISFKMPALPRNPRIKKAELRFFQSSGSDGCCGIPRLGLYRVTDGIRTGTCTPIHDTALIDYARMRSGHCEDGEVISYSFDITALADQVSKGETETKNLVLKMIDETAECDSRAVLYGSSHSGAYAPQFIVTYESGYGVNTSYRTHTHKLGRFGQGSIDLQCGNLMFDSEDFAWAGNRMPVTVRHLYNSALSAFQYTANSAIGLNAADFSAMKIGNGFKLNIMQSIVPADSVSGGGYVYIGENGEETRLVQSNKKAACPGNSQCYSLYEDVNGGDMLYDPEQRTLKQGDNTLLFDTAGRLIRITDASGNHMDITYTLGRITSVTDGAGRDFLFAYSGDFLTSVTAPDNTKVLYTYSGSLLSTITYPDGRKASISYLSDKPAAVSLLDASGSRVYEVAYAFTGDRLAGVTEYGSDHSAGAASAYSYSAASRRTIAETTEPADEADGETDGRTIKTVYAFDDDGSIVSEYVYSEDAGNTGVTGGESGIHPHSGDGGMGIVCNINNLLAGHNFESLDAWTSMPGNCDAFGIRCYAYESHAKFGRHMLRMQSCQEDCAENGVYQVTNTLPAGQYTFSAYLRLLTDYSGTDAGVYLRVTDTSGNVLGISERLTQRDSEYTRLIVPFSLADAQSVQVQILTNGVGTVYADAAQLENNPYANAYNLLENGNFERDTAGWHCTSGAACSEDTRFNMSKSLCITGSPEFQRCAYQTPAVRAARATRETFTLSGWAKGCGLPDHERAGAPAPVFRLRAAIKYYDSTYREYGTEEYTADFSPCTEEWQFASVQFSKSKYRTVQHISVYCDYGYNTGAAYFDDIQLVRNSLETSLAASDFVLESTGVSDAETEEAADTAADTAPDFREAKDAYGNTLTETTFTDGEFGTVYRAFGFTPDTDGAENAGNDLISETDARGSTTSYAVDEDTSRSEEVTDRLGNKTAYVYDASGRTAGVTSKTADGTALAGVSYAYDPFDNMTEIVRGDGMKYVLAYDRFHSLESVGIDGKTEKLIRYAYKPGSGRLKQLTYANGDTMKATYNSAGQMTGEKWYRADGALAAHYKYVYDGSGNIVHSIDFCGNKCYNYEYEEGRIVRATEANATFAGEIVTAKAIINTVKYYYDTDGKMTKKVITPASGAAQTVYYETNDDKTVVKFSAGGKTVTSHSKTDSFGRKVFDELQLGTDFVSRQFVYHAGKVTEEHKANAKVKSSATTQLVSQIILSGGRTISYEYDKEERITKVTDSVDGTAEYTYDALGQLLTETVNGAVVNAMTYDNYGNITSKNGVAYTYGNSTWKDLLTKIGEQTISYDAQGNPTSYLGHTLTWEKGRQLKSFDSNTYTYNANGIRTSKTVNGVKHVYTLDGTKILRETWNGNVLIPLYDNEDSVCGIIYNDEPYYFQKNLQGDIIAVVNTTAEVVARYSYDAWGVCTVTQDTSECGIASVNPFRYRGYFYDEEIGMYYLQSRYLNPSVGKFVNADIPEIVGLSVAVGNKTDTNLLSYCFNNPVNDHDISGGLSSKQLADMFSISSIAMLAMPILYVAYAKGLLAVGGYATQIVTPIALKAFWWKPWAAAAIIIAAVAIIVAAVGVYFSKQAKKSGKERATDAPSWVSSAMNAMPPHWGEKAKDYAKRLMDQKYGRGNWKTGAASEYNKIVKYLTRHVGMK